VRGDEARQEKSQGAAATYRAESKAMTILVTPIKPFRAWQYRKDSTEPVPEWVQRNYAKPFHSYYREDMEGWWYVEEQDCKWYTPAEFQERFRVEEGK
jgi:hypothetical protein